MVATRLAAALAVLAGAAVGVGAGVVVYRRGWWNSQYVGRSWSHTRLARIATACGGWGLGAATMFAAILLAVAWAACKGTDEAGRQMARYVEMAFVASEILVAASVCLGAEPVRSCRPAQSIEDGEAVGEGQYASADWRLMAGPPVAVGVLALGSGVGYAAEMTCAQLMGLALIAAAMAVYAGSWVTRAEVTETGVLGLACFGLCTFRLGIDQLQVTCKHMMWMDREYLVLSARSGLALRVSARGQGYTAFSRSLLDAVGRGSRERTE